LPAVRVGGAGDPPAPLGDSPSGTRIPRRNRVIFIPPGGSPGGTGKLPVLPTLVAYAALSLRVAALGMKAGGVNRIALPLHAGFLL
jgi:hypothetical protein